MADEIIVVGAGIVGISTALALQARGLSVRVLDRAGVAAEASQGNAGAFAFTDIIPLATPGIMRKAPKWLLDPLGPLSVQPAYALKITPWMLRFWRASRPDRYAASVAAQTALMEHCKAALNRQVADVQGEARMRREGQLQLYEGKRALEADRAGIEARRNHGIALDILESPEAIAEIQPGLNPRFTRAVFTPSWMNTTDPKGWTEYLARVFVERGGEIEVADITALNHQEGGVRLTTDKGPMDAQKVILAAGAWSHHIARTLGDVIPLETERGYNTTLPAGAFDIRTHLTFSGHGFVVTRIGDGVRVGGAVEFGGLNRPPNFKRADILLRKAADFLPGLDTKGGTQWMGFRPSLPDSLPVISRSPENQSVYYAFGHGHLGLTQSAGTAEIIADLITGQPAKLDLAPYAANRF